MNLDFETKYYNSNTLARINHVIKLSHDYAIKFKSSKDSNKLHDRYNYKVNKLVQELNFTNCEIALLKELKRHFGWDSWNVDSVEVPWLRDTTLAEKMEKSFKEWTENGDTFDCLTNLMLWNELTLEYDPAFDIHRASDNSYETVNQFIDFPFYETFKAFCYAYDSENGGTMFQSFKNTIIEYNNMLFGRRQKLLFQFKTTNTKMSKNNFIKEMYVDFEKVEEAAKELKELNETTIIHYTVFDERDLFVTDTSGFGLSGWGHNLSTYEELLAKVLCNTSYMPEAERNKILNSLTDNHFIAAYTLNYYFYHNYMNDEKIFKQFAEDISFEASYEFDSEEEKEDFVKELIYDDMEGCIIGGCTEATIFLARNLSDEELEDIVGTDLLPFAKYILTGRCQFFREVTNAYYLDKHDFLYDIIYYFFEENRTLMNTLIKENNW